MKMNKLSIGEMSELNNVSIQTLRYYDNLDLIKPLFTDPESGYRYYDINSLPSGSASAHEGSGNVFKRDKKMLFRK